MYTVEQNVPPLVPHRKGRGQASRITVPCILKWKEKSKQREALLERVNKGTDPHRDAGQEAGLLSQRQHPLLGVSGSAKASHP